MTVPFKTSPTVSNLSMMVTNIEAVARRYSVNNVFLEISQNSQKSTCARVSFLMKLQASACNFTKKETLAQVFSKISSEFCEISKNNFCYKTPPVAASANMIVCFQFSQWLTNHGQIVF